MIELGNDFRLGVPVAKAIYTVTHGTWEGVGVIPDVPVTAEHALEEAHRRALEALARSSGESGG
jgi:hypothetical protein